MNFFSVVVTWKSTPRTKWKQFELFYAFFIVSHNFFNFSEFSNLMSAPLGIFPSCFLLWASKLWGSLNLKENTGCLFWLVPPRKVLSMELVPPNREKWLSSPKMAKILTKKVKVRVRASHTFTFCCNLAEKIKDWQALAWTFTFLVGILLSSVN